MAADEYYAPGERVASFAQLQPGDLVFFAWDVGDPSSIHHVAIWLGGDAMLEAPRTGRAVEAAVTSRGHAVLTADGRAIVVVLRQSQKRMIAERW